MPRSEPILALDRCRARCRAALFDVVDPDQPFDCARYRDLAGAAIATGAGGV